MPENSLESSQDQEDTGRLDIDHIHIQNLTQQELPGYFQVRGFIMIEHARKETEKPQ
jgi:hypothetical protein